MRNPLDTARALVRQKVGVEAAEVDGLNSLNSLNSPPGTLANRSIGPENGLSERSPEGEKSEKSEKRFPSPSDLAERVALSQGHDTTDTIDTTLPQAGHPPIVSIESTVSRRWRGK
jgi:hypothetical protein